MEDNKNTSNSQSSSYEEDEITLKELIEKIQEFAEEIWNNWKKIVIAAIVMAVLLLLKAWLVPVTYEAELTFMLNDDEGGGGGAAAILGQFGFGGGSKSEVNINKMIELSKSRKIVGMVLFEKVTIDGTKDFIANHIIKEYDFHKRWEDSESLNGFLFQNGNVAAFSEEENSVLKSLHGFFIGGENQILNLSSNDESGILTLFITTTDEELSLAISENYFQNLENYYIEKAINKQQATYDMLLNRTDSIQQELDKNQLALLKFEDNNRSLGLKQYQMGRLRLEMEVQKLLGVYQESFKQLAIAEFNLQNKTPFITTIDAPILPLKRIKGSLVRALILGVFIGTFLMVVFVVGRKIYRGVMAD